MHPTKLLTLLPLLPLAFARTLTTPEIYLLTNCYSNSTNGSATSSSSVAYYWDSAFAFDGETPDKTGTIDNSSAVDYEGGTWTTLGSFRFSATINASADSFSASVLAGTASAETYALPLDCYRDSDEELYVNAAGQSCVSEYRCIDSEEDP